MSVGGDSAASLGILGFAVFVAAAAASFALLLLLLPILQRYAPAHPNKRSSHKMPIPQGGGIGVVASTVGIAAAGFVFVREIGDASPWYLFSATVLIAIVGAIDDLSPIAVLPRLLFQAVAVAIVVTTVPSEIRVVSAVPFWVERTLLGVAMLWFVNLVNFMDGIDWMTVVEVIPAAAATAFIGIVLGSPASEVVVALALCGAVVGFAPFNKPIARVFLGDVGSLAIGLLLAWLLLGLAGRGHIAAALLLPLYYLFDATITLIGRATRGEPIWQAHRTHFYQRAIERGMSVITVVGRVFVVNIALAALAIVSIWRNTLAVQAAVLACGAGLVCWLLYSLTHGRDRKA